MLRKLCLLVLIATAVSAVNATLVSHHEFEDSWTNSVSGGYSLTARGGANIATDAERGKVGGFQYFDTDEEWAYGGYDAAFNGLATITVAAWVKSNSTNWSDARIAGKGYGWYMYVSGSNVLGFNAGGGIVTGTTAINDAQWHHVAATYDTASGMMSLYVDGQLDVQALVSGSIPDTYGYAVGARAQSSTVGGNFYHGFIDDVRVYDDVQSLSQIQQFSGVPEPATICMLGLGALGLIRRKR